MAKDGGFTEIPQLWPHLLDSSFVVEVLKVAVATSSVQVGALTRASILRLNL